MTNKPNASRRSTSKRPRRDAAPVTPLSPPITDEERARWALFGKPHYDPEWHAEHIGMDSNIFPATDGHTQYAATEIARYLVWLGENMSEPVSPVALAALAYEGIALGRWWSEIAEEQGLPVPPDWE